MGVLSSDLKDNTSNLDGTTSYNPPPVGFTPNRPTGGSRGRRKKKKKKPNFSNQTGGSSYVAPPPSSSPVKREVSSSIVPPSLQPKTVTPPKKKPSQFIIRQSFTPSRPRSGQETIELKPQGGYVPKPEYKKLVSTVERAELFGDFGSRTEQKSQTTSNPGAKIIYGGALVGYGGVEYVKGLALDLSPFDFKNKKARIPLSGAFHSVTHPIKTAKDFVKFTGLHPERGAGQLATMWAVGRAGGKVAEGKPSYTTSRATGNVKVLETPVKTQILVETATKPFKGKGTPPTPKPFFAKIKGYTIETTGKVMNKFNVKDIVKINPLKKTVEIVKRKSEQVGASQIATKIPDKWLARSGRVLEKEVKVASFERAIIKPGKVYLAETFKKPPKAGQLGTGKFVEGLNIFQQKVKGYIRTQTTRVEHSQLLGKGVKDLFSIRKGTIIKKPKAPIKVTTKKGSVPIDTYALHGANPGEMFTIQRVSRVSKPIVSVNKLPISPIKTGGSGAVKVVSASETKAPTPKTSTQQTPQSFGSTPGIAPITVEYLVKDFNVETAQPTTRTSKGFVNIGKIAPPEPIVRTADLVINRIEPQITPSPSSLFSPPKVRSRSKSRSAEVFKPTTQPPVTITEITQKQTPEQTPILAITPVQGTRHKFALPTFRSLQPKLFIPLPFSNFNNEKEQGSGFNVFVRRKGTFRRVNPQTLSRSDAIGFGAVRVGTTAGATFKIKPSNSRITGAFKQRGFLSDFVKKGNLWIEKPSRRIKSSGEKKEITYKGIWMNKKHKGGIRWGF